MAVSCSNCGGSHPVWDCRAKSTAALKEVQAKAKGGNFVHKGEAQSDGELVAQLGERPPAGGRSRVQLPPAAGTQALPVDTKSENIPSEKPKAHGSSPCIGSREDHRPATYGKLVTAGETATKFDKKAWSRDYMRIFMRQYRSEVKSGTRVPKRKGEK